MVRKLPKGVTHYADRHGKLRWRYRDAKSRIDTQTAAVFGSPEWWAWYHASVAGAPARHGVGAERTKPGSLNDLIVRYYTSSDWKLLAKATQSTYRGVLDRFRAKHGDKPYRGLEGRHIRSLMDARASQPATANKLLKVLRALFAFAVERELVNENPTRAIRRLKDATDGWHTWTEDEISQFDARWPLGTKERLAKDLLLFTAQRSGDVRRMGLQHVRCGYVSVRQEKTTSFLEIKLHPMLRASIEAYPAAHLTFLTTQYGEPFTPGGFGNWFRDAVRAAGLPFGVSAHGLRKAAARRLAEAGATAHQIMAVTGHKTLKEVERYTKAAAQRGLAEQAIDLITGTEPEQILSNLQAELDNRTHKGLKSQEA